jgi:hypothetical protein
MVHESSNKKNPYEFQILSKALPFSHKRYFSQKILQKIYAFSTNDPYLSGDSFEALVDYVAYGKDGNSKINRIKLRRAKTVFVVGHKLNELVSEEFNNINAKVLISGNSDKNFDTKVQLPKSIKLWLCQNNSISDSNIVRTLPIGIENIRLANLGFPKYYRKKTIDKILNKVIITPMSATNFTRFAAVKWGEENPEIADVYREMVLPQEYFQTVNKYKFVLCCEGNGFDSHRLWETLYLNNFPILLKTEWSKSLKNLNLPILIVDTYGQINQELLLDFYNRWKNFEAINTEALWIPYWEKLIKSYIACN